MPPYNAPSWRDLATSLEPNVRFAAPATEEELQQVEAALGVSLPVHLRDLLLETDGIHDRTGATIVWRAEEIIKRNLYFRDSDGWEDLYMPFDHLLFFGDNGGGDQFAYPIQVGGSINNYDVLRWVHETDAREWYANRLEVFLEKRLSDECDDC